MPTKRFSLRRTRVVACAALIVLGWMGLSAAAPGQAQRPDPGGAHHADAEMVRAVTGVAVTVDDLDRSVEWYTRVLDATVESTAEHSGESFERLVGVFGARARSATLRIGQERLLLIDYLTPTSRPFPADSRSNDRWFQHVAIIVRDMNEAYARLVSMGVNFASSGPQRLPDWNPNAGGISAFYFRDPDGHYLEVLHFPEGKGQDRWHSDGRLFLGIDHTAIVVADTDASLRYYRDHLGMSVAGTSENYGPEQEHLNGVFAARLRITSLRAPTGPAIELLEYLTPRDGRDMPRDTRASDLWCWSVFMEVDDPGAMFEACRAAGGSPISPGAQPLEGGASSQALTALMATDPDGHALLFTKSPTDDRR